MPGSTSFYYIWLRMTNFRPPIETTLRFPVWGFYVYRTTYKDQDAWEKYIDYVTKSVVYIAETDAGLSESWLGSRYMQSRQNDPGVQKTLEIGRVIRDHFHLCPREGPELDGKSIEEIRNIHLQWLASLPDEGVSHNEDGSHNCADLQTGYLRSLLNHTHYYTAMFVDDDVLARFMEDWKADQFREPDHDGPGVTRASVVIFRAADHREREKQDMVEYRRRTGTLWVLELEKKERAEAEAKDMSLRLSSLTIEDGKPEEGNEVEMDNNDEKDDEDENIDDGQGEKLWMRVHVLAIPRFYNSMEHNDYPAAWDSMFVGPNRIWGYSREEWEGNW